MLDKGLYGQARSFDCTRCLAGEFLAVARRVPLRMLITPPDFNAIAL